MMLSCDSYQQFPLLAAAFHIDIDIAIVPRLVQLIIMHRLMATLCALQTHFRRPSMSAPIIGGPHVCKCNVYTPWGVARAKMFLLGYNKLSTDKTICSPPRHRHRHRHHHLVPRVLN